MSQASKNRRKPAAPRYSSRRWPVVAAVAVTAVMTAGAALAAISSLPAPAAAQPVAAAPAPIVDPAPEPSIGKAFYASMPDKTVAAVTIRSAAFTAPGRLVLDTRWEAHVGTATSDPAWFDVRDATGARLTPVDAGPGALKAEPVTPGTPRSGLVAYNTAGPVTVVVTDMSHMQPTYIPVKP